MKLTPKLTKKANESMDAYLARYLSKLHGKTVKAVRRKKVV